MVDFGIKDVQHFFTQKILSCDEFGSGDCNLAYHLTAEDGKNFIVKKRKEKPDALEQNSLFVEAKLLQFLSQKHFCIPTPKIAFLSEKPDMYGYEYIEGTPLRKVWKSIDEKTRLKICTQLGQFHAELASSVSREESVKLGIEINLSSDLHPETLKNLEKIHTEPEIPEEIKKLAQKMKYILDSTASEKFFHLIHNDAHHENILVENDEITGFVDFGDAEFGEVTKEFSRYIRDFPEYFEYIVTSYEETTGNKLSRKRLISYSFLSGLIDNVEMWKQGGAKKDWAHKNIMWYKNALENIS